MSSDPIHPMPSSGPLSRSLSDDEGLYCSLLETAPDEFTPEKWGSQGNDDFREEMRRSVALGDKLTDDLGALSISCLYSPKAEEPDDLRKLLRPYAYVLDPAFILLTFLKVSRITRSGMEGSYG